jgi:hypothetical protein
VNDSRFTTSATIQGYMNQGVKTIAGGVRYVAGLPPTPPLPDLLTTSSITYTSGASYASLPSNFQRKIVLAVDSDGDRVPVEESWKAFLKVDPGLDDTGGEIRLVCQRGSKLYCHPKATSGESLTLHYHRFPTDMSAGTDTPDGIPNHLHEQAMEAWAAKEIFTVIEDSVDQQGTNTAKWTEKFNQAMLDLFTFIGPEDEEPVYIADEEDYCRW